MPKKARTLQLEVDRRKPVRPTSQTALAAAVLDHYDWPDDPSDQESDWFLETPAFGALRDGLFARLTSGERTLKDSSKRLREIDERLSHALSEDLWALVLESEELETQEQIVTVEAAYLVGIAVARRMMRGGA